MEDLTDVVRTMQHEVIRNVCRLLDDPGLLGIHRDAPAWEPTAPPGPSLDEHDPSGRSGEPRGRPVPARLPGTPGEAKAALDALLDDTRPPGQP